MHWRKAARMKRETQDMIGWFIRKQLPQVQITRPVVVTCQWVEPNRLRDRDNIAFARKFIQDALVECKVLPGDGWRHIIDIPNKFSVDATNPRVEVWIEEVGA